MSAAQHPRSSGWPKVEHEHVSQFPGCAACGFTHVEVHHIHPFHLYPADELNPANLITLCRSGKNCHLLIGHGDNFEEYNPNVVADAAECLANPEKFSEIVARAKTNRLAA